MKKSKCATEDCNKNDHTLGLCQCCYQRARYWDQKNLSEKMKRIKNLRVYGNSLNDQVGVGRKLKAV